MATFEVLDELMEITGSTELHKRMRFWFVQEIAEEEERGVADDSLESLKQTHARETAKLAALTDVIAESLAGIHEKECHVAKLDLNDYVFIEMCQHAQLATDDQTINLKSDDFGHESNEDDNNKKKNDNKKNANKRKRKPSEGIGNKKAECWK
ncbi:hypothetical protein Tco_0872659 [Tanacetum coccineum]